MFLKNLLLRSFRNYTKASISFEKGINIIKGRNGAGKTNLLEAIFLLSTGRSFRTMHFTDLIQEGASYFYIEAHFEKERVKQVLGIGYSKRGRRIHYNNTYFYNISHLFGIMPSVLYSPKDQLLISGSPTERRRFLNMHLAQTTPLYLSHLIRYYRAMKQRNVLLKHQSQQAIESFEKVMADSAHYLMGKRHELIERLNPRMQAFSNILSSHQDSFSLFYKPSICMQQVGEIELLYATKRPKELILGSTISGPHRDDFLFTYNNKDAKAYASEGQKQTCITALKMAEWEELKNQTQTLPLMNIDDFGTHFDKMRVHLFQKYLSNLGQVFLTTPIVEGIPTAHCVHIEGGNLCTVV